MNRGETMTREKAIELLRELSNFVATPPETAVDYKPHFCENCGARMRGDAE